jgi:hypothetical protein
LTGWVAALDYCSEKSFTGHLVHFGQGTVNIVVAGGILSLDVRQNFAYTFQFLYHLDRAPGQHV